MRKPIHLRRTERKQRWFIPLFIVSLMVLSVLGYTVGNNTSSQKVTYNEYEFTPDIKTNLWTVTVNDQEFSFSNLPQDLVSLPLSKNIRYPRYQWGTLNENLTGVSNYISFVKSELRLTLGQQGFIVKEPLSIRYDEQNVVDCADAQQDDAVIVFELSNVTEIVNENHCIHIRAISGQGFVMAKDRFIYSILGIMP